MCVCLLVCRSVCLSTHQLSIIDLRAKPSFKCLKKLKGNNLLFFNSVFTKPKVLTRNKLYRAHSRYDEFFLRPWMRVACCILTSLHTNVIGLSSVDPTKVRSSFCQNPSYSLRLRAALLVLPPPISLQAMLLHVYQQVTRPDTQGHWSGPLCPMFYPWPAICGCLSSLQHIQTLHICTQKSYKHRCLPRNLQNWRKVYNASWFLYFIGNRRSFVYILIVLCIPRAKPCTSATYYDWIIQINYLFKIWLFSDSLLS